MSQKGDFKITSLPCLGLTSRLCCNGQRFAIEQEANAEARHRASRLPGKSGSS